MRICDRPIFILFPRMRPKLWVSVFLNFHSNVSNSVRWREVQEKRNRICSSESALFFVRISHLGPRLRHFIAYWIELMASFGTSALSGLHPTDPTLRFSFSSGQNFNWRRVEIRDNELANQTQWKSLAGRSGFNVEINVRFPVEMRQRKESKVEYWGWRGRNCLASHSNIARSLSTPTSFCLRPQG